jgi:hypothetical protein
MHWLVVWVLAVALNAMPSFMPPTWAMLAYFHLYHGLSVVPLALAGALGATTGRAVLALGSREFGDRFLPASWRSNIEALVATLESRPALALPSLALFALGPVPSNHLFIAAGLARAPLPPILAVFGAARFVSYVLWVSAADVADRSLRDVFGSRVAGWGAIAVQLAGFGLIVLAMRVDWRRLLQGRPSTAAKADRAGGDRARGAAAPDGAEPDRAAPRILVADDT